jgi:hypothetical protein
MGAPTSPNRSVIWGGSNAVLSPVSATPFVMKDAPLRVEYPTCASYIPRASGPVWRGVTQRAHDGDVALMRVVGDSLKFGAGTADNLDMGNAPSMQQRTPGSRTERVGA